MTLLNHTKQHLREIERKNKKDKNTGAGAWSNWARKATTRRERDLGVTAWGVVASMLQRCCCGSMCRRADAGVGASAMRHWLAAVRASGFNLSRSGGSDRLFPFKVIWDFSRLWRIWDFSGLWRIMDFILFYFFSRLVTRSLCSCVLCWFICILFLGLVLVIYWFIA